MGHSHPRRKTQRALARVDVLQFFAGGRDS
jgi:hypothetical protein